ncbi:MAG: hypothetical protein ACLR0P_04575 [Oscillospiraceae bacterium]
MNANPFTLGHRHLVERAARENDVVHLFVLSEEAGPIPSAVRRELVEQGVRDLPSVFCHATGPLPHQLRHLPQLLSEGLRYSHSDPGGAGPADLLSDRPAAGDPKALCGAGAQQPCHPSL